MLLYPWYWGIWCSTKTLRQKMESQLGCRYSSLLQLPYFDPIHMLVIDPMHNLYLGTAKYILHRVWISKGILNTKHIAEVNNRISSLRIPPNVRFSCLPADIQSSTSFTAEQWMLWVNHYSLFCFYDLLPSNQFDCWNHFVLASRLMCKRQLSSTEISVADALLLQFCRRYESIYGTECVTPNIHMHCHLVDCVKEFGPMSTFWCFSFGCLNGVRGDQPTNNRSIELQFMQRFLNDNSHYQLLSTMPVVLNVRI